MISSSPENVIETRHLRKCYGKLVAVKDLNLTVFRGDVFGFLGPNGAGKSTTIRMLVDLIRPTAGEIRLFGLSLARNRADVLGKVGALVEKPDFYDFLTARENLHQIARMLPGVTRSAIDEVLEIVGLTARANERVKAYSHGMRQRLGIAQALLGRPELVILDEPTIGLDPQGMREVRLLIRQLAEQGMTVFLSSHLLHEVEQVCTRMAIINHGELVVEGSVEDLLHSQPAQLVLELNASTELLEQVRRLPFVGAIVRENRTWKVEVPFGRIPELNRFLVERGAEIFRMEPKTTLEDYYLSLVSS